jgi:hypothetical protein
MADVHEDEATAAARVEAGGPFMARPISPGG